MNWSNNPRCLIRIILGFCISALLFASVGRLEAKPKTPAEKENDIPTPPGYTDKGVKIPMWEDGKLQMLFNMETACRLKKELLRMTNLVIETYGDEGKLDLRIAMPASLFNIDTSVVSSTDPVSIHRSDFEVTGTNMSFNTQTRKGTFVGQVHMLIFDSNQFAQVSPGHSASASTPQGGAQ